MHNPTKEFYLILESYMDKNKKLETNLKCLLTLKNILPNDITITIKIMNEGFDMY